MSPSLPTPGSPVSVVMNGTIVCTTNVPWPGGDSTRPRVMSSLMASRMVLRDALCCWRSSSSVGSWVPRARSPASIWRRRSSAICRYIGSTTAPPRDPNHPDGWAGWTRKDHTHYLGLQNLWAVLGLTPFWGVITTEVPKVGMTRMARSIGVSLAVGLLGRTWISRLGPNTRLSPATHTGREDSKTAVPTAEGRKEGDPPWPPS